MNCNTCRYELSQCLDGRLPSGRRAIVMQHTEVCPACSQFWTELQAAQQLTLRLRQPQVGDDFREGLWQRIHAGEGTPEAVFQEAVPMWTKVRYTLTGAAAAAAALLAVTYFSRSEDRRSDGTGANDTLIARSEVTRDGVMGSGALAGSIRADSAIADSAIADSAIAGSTRTDSVLAGSPGGNHGRGNRSQPQTLVVADSPLISSAQPLTFQLVAVETARQLEQRHAAVSVALRLIDDPDSNRDAAVARAIENAQEFRSFGELLLDLRERKRLFFTDNQVDADLRFAVNMLGQGPVLGGSDDAGRDGSLRDRQPGRDLRTVLTIVEPALRSDRLGNVSRTISIVPSEDFRDELDALLRLNTQRPEVFPKLFFVLGNDDALSRQLELMRPGMAFFMEDVCGPSWVAPRSEVEARDGLLRMLRRQFGESGDVKIQIEVRHR